MKLSEFIQAIETDEKSRAGSAIPVFLFLFALALRLYAALVPGIIFPDGIMYINTAKMIDAGQWGKLSHWGFFYNIYPFFIAALHKVINDWEFCARILSVFFGSLAIVPLYWIVKRIFDIRLAIMVSIFFIISPRLVEYSSNVIREPVFWFFALSALSAAVRGIQQKQWFFMALAALCIGLSIFTRMEGIALIPIILIWIYWFYQKEKAFAFKTFLMLSVVFLLSFPVIFGSPLILVKEKIGHWEFGLIGSRLPQMFGTGNTPAQQELQKDNEGSDAVTKTMSGNRYLVFLWQTVYKFFRSYHVLFIILFIVGIVRRKLVPYNSREILIGIWWSVFFIVALLYISRTHYLSTRHGMLMGIPGLLWVSIGFFELSDIIKKWVRRYKKIIFARQKQGIEIAVLIIVCIIVLPSTLSWSGVEKVEMKKAGIFLKKNVFTGQHLAVESRLNRLAFYSEADYVTIPDNIDAAELSHFLRSRKIDYLLIDKKTVGSSLAMFIEKSIDNDLEEININEFNNYKNYSFTLFKIKNNSSCRAL